MAALALKKSWDEKYFKWAALGLGTAVVGGVAITGFYLWSQRPTEKIKEKAAELFPEWLFEYLPTAPGVTPPGVPLQTPRMNEIDKTLQLAYDLALEKMDATIFWNAYEDIEKEMGGPLSPLAALWAVKRLQWLNKGKQLDDLIYEKQKAITIEEAEEIAKGEAELLRDQMDDLKAQHRKNLEWYQEQLEKQREQFLEEIGKIEEWPGAAEGLPPPPGWGVTPPLPVVTPTGPTWVTPTQEVKFEEMYPEGWSNFKKEFGKEEINEFMWARGVSKEEASPNNLRVMAYFSFTGENPDEQGITFFGGKYYWRE